MVRTSLLCCLFLSASAVASGQDAGTFAGSGAPNSIFLKRAAADTGDHDDDATDIALSRGEFAVSAYPDYAAAGEEPAADGCDTAHHDCDTAADCDTAHGDCGDAACGHAACDHGACEDSACDAHECVECCSTFPRFYVQADAVFLERDNSDGGQPVVINNNTLATLISTDDLDFDNETAARFLLGYRVNCSTAVEFSYLGPLDWNSSQTAAGDNDLAIPGDLGLASLDFFAADIMTVTHSSELENLEVNLARCLCGWEGVEVLAGFRYLSLDESFNINSTDLDTGTSDYNIQSRNDLYGGQIGARVRRCAGWFGWEVTGKAGIFNNRSEQSQFVSDFPPGFFLRPLRTSSDDSTAFVGELSFIATVPLNCTWSLRGGYNLLWIDEVARAAGQLDFTDTPSSGGFVNSNGDLFLHGASVGIEGRW